MFGIDTAGLKKAFGFGEEKKAVSLLDLEAHAIFGSVPTASGAVVNAHTALQVPAVLQAVRLIAETVGSLPCKLYGHGSGSKEAADSHPAYRLVHDRVNGWTSAGQLRTLLTRDALLHGAGYAQVIRVGEDRPFELHRLAPGTVHHRTDRAEPYFLVTDGKGTRELPFRDVLYLPTFDGHSVVAVGRRAIGLSMVLERHGERFFADGARPSGLITSANNIDPTNAKGATTLGNILASWRRWTTGATGEPLVLDNGQNYVPLTMASTDAQFLENRVEQVREIARIFGVPPTMIFELSRGTFSNTEQMAQGFLQLCLRPWLDRWQDAYDTVLLSDAEQRTHYFEFVIDDLQRADAAGRAEIFGKLVAMRAMTPNEVRAAMNLPALPGGDDLANPYTTTTTTGPATAPVKDAA